MIVFISFDISERDITSQYLHCVWSSISFSISITNSQQSAWQIISLKVYDLFTSSATENTWRRMPLQVLLKVSLTSSNWCATDCTCVKVDVALDWIILVGFVIIAPKQNNIVWTVCLGFFPLFVVNAWIHIHISSQSLACPIPHLPWKLNWYLVLSYSLRIHLLRSRLESMLPYFLYCWLRHSTLSCLTQFSMSYLWLPPLQ